VTGLLTVLSVVVAWALIGVLLVALLLVFKELQSIRHWFEKITVGVRAVEHQTGSLAERGDVLTASLREALEALHVASGAPTDRPTGQEHPWRT
jgi:anaerobic C4-dicarboxylate transporter